MTTEKKTQLIASRLPGFFEDEPNAIYLSYEQTPSKLKEHGLRCLDDEFDGPQLKRELYRVHEICGPTYLRTTEWLFQNFKDEFGIDWNLSQTRSLFNSWFHSFITSAYDMQARVDRINELDEFFFAAALSPESFRNPCSSVELKGLCSSEIGRQQLFTIFSRGIKNVQLEIRHCKVEAESVPMYTVLRNIDLITTRPNFIHRLRKKKWAEVREALKRRIAHLVGHIFEPIAYLIDIHLPARLENNLLIRGFGKIRLLSPDFQLKASGLPLDPGLRSRLCRPRGEDLFSCTVMEAFESFLPKSCAEGFLENHLLCQKIIPSQGKMHFSYAHQSDEKYAFFSNALRQSKGQKLYSTMHAGPYFLANLWQLPLSLGTDAIVGFGGEERLFSNSLKIGGAYKTDFERTNKFSSDDIVYFSTVMPQGSIDGSFSSVQMDRYFQAQRIFFTTISPNLKKKILYRPFKQDFGRGFSQKMLPYLKDIRIDDLSYTGIERMQHSKIVFCDNINTVYYEAIKLGVPTLLVIDPDLFLELETYQDLYKAMYESNILWHDLPAAIKFLESIAENPDKWWNSTNVKSARAMFLNYLDPFSSSEIVGNLLAFIKNNSIKN
jgi:putative transferase (TIGR04331 family)